MILIKRYPNRKLYNTRDKCYITLEQIAKHIHLGEEIQVIDYLSGEDLTSLTLSQIIFELEKNKAGSLPRNILSNIIRFTAGATPLRGFFTLEEDGSESFNNEVKSRLSLLERYNLVNHDEAEEILKLLVEIYPSLIDSTESEFIDQVKHALATKHIPTRAQISQIKKQLAQIAQEIDKLVQNQRKT